MTELGETAHIRKYLSSIMGKVPFGVITLSINHEVGVINADAIKLLGFVNSRPEDFIDTRLSDVFSNITAVINAYEKLTNAGEKVELDLCNLKINRYTVNIRIRELFNGSIITIEDVTTQTTLARQLRYQASHDHLTDLGNRKGFEACVGSYLPKTIRHNLTGAVLFVDLDRFKPINDLAGHTAGDELLKKVAILISSNVRERDVVARIGGDEFAVLLTDCPLRAAEKIAESIRKTIDEMVFIFEEHSFKVSVSIGISCICRENNKVSTIINSADNACQIAKNLGRNQLHTALPDTSEYKDHKQQVAWLPRITQALQQNQFTLYMQEIADVRSPKTDKHYEILIRLVNADGSITLPQSFIPPAERYDLMPQVDRWVIEYAFSNIDKNTNYSINLSGLSTCDPTLADFIESLSQIHVIDARRITFEITETAAIQNIAKCLGLIGRLKALGFKFSLDDFGSGLSSFTYLKNLTIDYLKIDGSFVKEIAHDSASYAMVKSINEVGHAMGLETIAEFVENQSILNKLQEIGVDYVQGYHIHKPEQLKPAHPSS